MRPRWGSPPESSPLFSSELDADSTDDDLLSPFKSEHIEHSESTVYSRSALFSPHDP